jgi:uncharacterized protein (TIGR00743 family)
MSQSKNAPEFCEACLSLETSMLIDGSVLTFEFEKEYASEQQAKQALEKATQKATQVASEPCQITSTITNQSNNFLLKSSFTFTNQAEMMIFEMFARTL